MRLGRRTDGTEKPPRPGRRQFLQALLGGLLIVLLAAGATAAVTKKKVGAELKPFLQSRSPTIKTKKHTLEIPKPGKAQTILILGSDHRYGDGKGEARSDTIMLLRLDPKQAATTMLSIPRDLKVTIPGHGLAKINDAYTFGGPDLTVQTITALTGLKINHVVNVQFKGFRKAIDQIGCVYTDVDRRYYHSNVGLGIGQRYSEIDLQPGYQKLCGTDALSYVRFRHTDSDIVRGARQQDFLRAIKDQVSASALFGQRKKLETIFGDNTEVDKDLKTYNGLVRVLKLALFSAGHPVRQVQFPAVFDKEVLPGGAEIDYVLASPASVTRTVEDFMHPPKDKAPAAPATKKPAKGKGKKKAAAAVTVPGIIDARALSRQAIATAKITTPLSIPLYYPTHLTELSRYGTEDTLRTYRLRDRAGRSHEAYRMVVIANEQEGQYYGVQGTDWRSPPLLQAKHTMRTVHGRRLALYRDGSRLRFVSWRTASAVYWVSNTLSLKLTNAQMLEIASTLSRRSAGSASP